MKTLKNAFLTILFLAFAGCNSNQNVQDELIVGIQTYSFRTMDDQSPISILNYIKETGIKHVELMGNHAESFAGAPESPMSNPDYRSIMMKRYRNLELTSEEQELAEVISEEVELYNLAVQEWRKNVDYTKFETLRDLYAEAGILIYAFKPRVFEKENTDDDIRYGMRAAKALGASHVTLEHPSDDEHTARLAKIAEEENIIVAYHGHMQQTPTLWDTAIEQSSANWLNLDFGHYIAAENENPLQIILDKKDRIASMHLKDRQRNSNGGANLEWGKGDTPIVELIQLMKNNKCRFPVTIELEYDIPEGSNAVEEVKKCLAYITNIKS